MSWMATETRQGGTHERLVCNYETVYKAYKKGINYVSPGLGQVALAINRNEKNEQQREKREGVEAKMLFTILGGSRSACTEQRDAAD